MTHDEFKIGSDFMLSGQKYRCTDVGTRVIIAIKIGPFINVFVNDKPTTLSELEAEDQEWFQGPPYAVREIVFDEDDIQACVPLED